jgi:hypothetical protein
LPRIELHIVLEMNVFYKPCFENFLLEDRRQ